MTNFDETSLEVYFNRGRQLASGMKRCRDDLHSLASAAALLAVHSAISYADAVELGLTGKLTKGDDHRQKLTAVKRACGEGSVNNAGIAHLQKLLGAKDDIAYSDRLVGEQKAAGLCEAAIRFQVWAERILMKNREG